MVNSADFYSGVITPDELYTLRTFKRRLEISDHTLRAARRNGLRVRYLHKQGYILGRDWIEYVLSSTTNQEDNGPTSVSS